MIIIKNSLYKFILEYQYQFANNVLFGLGFDFENFIMYIYRLNKR